MLVVAVPRPQVVAFPSASVTALEKAAAEAKQLLFVEVRRPQVPGDAIEYCIGDNDDDDDADDDDAAVVIVEADDDDGVDEGLFESPIKSYTVSTPADYNSDLRLVCDHIRLL